MERKQKEVWVLTCNPYEGGLEVYGVYTDEDLATDAINDELFMQYLSGRTATDELVESFYTDIKPEIIKSILI